MSLIHWYPLNNSLEDLGCGQAITPSISGTPTFSNTGKTGNYCLAASETLAITDSTLAGARVWSCCFWGYVISASVPNNWLGLFHITDGSSNIRVEVCPKGNYVNDIYCYSIHNNSGNAIFSSSIPTSGDRYDCWAHFAITCDGSSISTYINGNRMGSIAYNGSGTITGSFRLINNHIVRKNDLRIYDHALSAKEVKEISKGLVLHYNFEDEYIEPTTNIDPARSTAPSFSYAATKEKVIFRGKECWHFIIENNGSIWSYSSANGYAENSVLTRSCWLYIPSGQTNRAGWYGLPFAFEGMKSISNRRVYDLNKMDTWQYCYCTGTAQSTSSNYLLYMLADGSATAHRIEFYITDIQLEEKDHATPYVNGTRNGEKVYDSSGYGNNGTNNGVILSNESSSGRFSAQFASDAYIEIPSLPQFDKVTYSMWVKIPSNAQAYRSIFIPKGDPTTGGIWLSVNTEGVNLWVYQGGNSPSYCKGTSTLLSADTWYLYTHTFDGTTGQNYLNGVAVGSAATYTTRTYIPSGVYTLGDSYTGTYWSGTPFDGKIADFKIYATALSAEDIKAEYNRKAAIDKNGNLFTGEIIETTYNLLTSENLLNGRVNTSATSNVGEIVTRNNYPAYRISPVPYWSGDGATSKNICKGQFGPGQYIFDLWIDVDEVYYDGNGQWVPGGFEVYYTDGSVENVIVDANSTQGHSGYQHLISKTNANKTISGLGVYYYIHVPIYIRCDSVICKVNSDGKICKNNIIAGGQFVEPAVSDSKCKLTRYGVVSNAIKEL